MNFPIPLNDVVLTIIVCLFVMGLISIGLGIYILASKVLGQEIKELASQTAKLASKGVADDVYGLVGNASSLIEALDSLVKTTSGIGVFLVMLGCVFLASGYYMVIQVI